MFTYVVTTTVDTYFFIRVWDTVWCSSVSTWRNPLSISCRTSTGNKLPQVLFICIYLNFSFSFWNVVLLHVKFLIGRFFFPFSTSSKSFHCLLVSWTTDEKSLVNLTDEPCTRWITSLLLQNSLLCLDSILIIMYLGEVLIRFLLFRISCVSCICR